ncbi:MAG TPA: DUF1707 domain-containing protein [Propionibacteriaceae bacterium]
MTENSTEPRNVGPIAGGNLRASDADREQVATVLSTAYAEGRLTRDEHDERLEQLLRARTFDELLPITRDLVIVNPPSPSQVSTTTNGPFTIDTSSASQESEKMVAIFGGVTRKGKWRVRKHTQALALFGGIDLDLRDAIFEGPVVEISGFWCFGGLDIKVPEGIEVRDQTAGVFGGTDVSHVGEPLPGAPVLVIKGMTLFGGVSVSGPKPAKKRR